MLCFELPYEVKQTKSKIAFKDNLKSHNNIINNIHFTKGNITIFNKKDGYYYHILSYFPYVNVNCY